MLRWPQTVRHSGACGRAEKAARADWSTQNAAQDAAYEYVRTTTVLGTVFGDGLQCVAGDIERLGIEFNSAVGSSSYGAPAGDLPISVKGMVPVTGGTFFYQIWYRDPASFCTSDGFNFSNALSVLWVP